MRPLKVLQIVQCTNLGGMERASAGRMRILHEKFQVSFRVTSPRPEGEGAFLFRKFDPEAHFFNYRGKYNVFGHQAFAAHVAEVAKTVDVICVTGTCASSLRAASATGKPVILDHHFCHGNDLISRIKWRSFYELLCHRLSAIVYVSKFIRDEAVSIAPWIAEKAYVVPQPIPVPFVSSEDRFKRQQEARQRLGLPKDAWIVGNAGWLIPGKRFDIFLEVAAAIKQHIPAAYFVICGDGELGPALRRQAEALHIADSVDFRGWVVNVGDHYWAWDELLFNTDYDANPRTPLEAIGYGLNVVASSKYGGLSDFFSEEGCGFFFRDHDVEAMTKASERLWKEKETRERLRERALLQLKQRHSETEVERFLQIFSPKSR